MIDAEVVDADASEDTEDLLNKLDNFDLDNVLDKESDCAFVWEVVEYSRDNEVVLGLQGKNYIYNQEHYDREDSTNILLDNQSNIHMTVNSKLFKNIRKSEQV